MPYRHHFAESLAAVGNIIVTAMIASIATQFGADIVAAVGAAVAGFIACVDANRKQHDSWQTTCVFVASVAVGWMAPGALVWFAFPSHFASMPWQAWAGLGFIFGLLGWAVTVGILALRNRIPGVIGEFANRYFPEKDKPKEPKQ